MPGRLLVERDRILGMRRKFVRDVMELFREGGREPHTDPVNDPDPCTWAVPCNVSRRYARNLRIGLL